MAWEWLSAAVGGIIGAGGTYLGSRTQLAGQKTAAREERHERRQEADLELLGEVAVCDDWIEMLFTRWNDRQEGPPPKVPQLYMRRLSTEGRLSVWWSPRICQLVTTLQQQMRELYRLWLRNMSANTALAERRDPGVDVLALLNTFTERKDEFDEFVQAIRDQVPAELSGKS